MVAHQRAFQVDLEFWRGADDVLGVLLKGDYTGLALSMVVSPTIGGAATYTWNASPELTKTLKNNVYRDPDTGKFSYTNPGGWTDLGQYTEVLLAPTLAQRNVLATPQKYWLVAVDTPLIGGRISSAYRLKENSTITSPSSDVLLAPAANFIALVGLPAPSFAVVDPAIYTRLDALEAVLVASPEQITALVDGGNSMLYNLTPAIYRSTARVYLDEVPQAVVTDYAVNAAGDELLFTFVPAGTLRVEGVEKP